MKNALKINGIVSVLLFSMLGLQYVLVKYTTISAVIVQSPTLSSTEFIKDALILWVSVLYVLNTLMLAMSEYV